MRLGRDGIAGLIGLAVSLLLLPQALSLPKLPIVPVGPGFYPSIVLIFLGVTSAALLAQDLIAQRRAVPAPAAGVSGPRRAYALVAVCFAIVAAYVALLPLLGFRIATAVFVGAFQLVLAPPASVRHWAVLIAVAIGTSAVTYVVFNDHLLVLLPRGSLTDW